MAFRKNDLYDEASYKLMTYFIDESIKKSEAKQGNKNKVQVKFL